MKNKKEYIPICFVKVFVSFEESIGAGSAEVSGGTASNVFSPDVEEWGEEMDGGKTQGDI